MSTDSEQSTSTVDTSAGDAERGGQAGSYSAAADSHRPLKAILAIVSALALFAAGWAIGFVVHDHDEGSLAKPPETSVDVGFARDMQVHHLQATEMAGVVRDKTADDDIELLAFDIETGQLNQIGQMLGWLSLWGYTPNNPDAPMLWMQGDAGAAHHDASEISSGQRMPGMATEEELATLRNAEGHDLDVLFLQLMIRHHQGGIPMATYAAEHAESPLVRNLANKMTESQANEVINMEQMLRERGATPFAPPE